MATARAVAASLGGRTGTDCRGCLEKLATLLQSRETALAEREQYHEQAEHQFRVRQRKLTHLHQHLVAWRARLKTRENALESERDQLLTEVQNREDLVQKHVASLVDLRRRWIRRRRHELAQLHADCGAFAKLLEECNGLRKELLDRTAALDEEKRILTDKALALEESRQEFLLRIDHREPNGASNAWSAAGEPRTRPRVEKSPSSVRLCNRRWPRSRPG